MKLFPFPQTHSYFKKNIRLEKMARKVKEYE